LCIVIFKFLRNGLQLLRLALNILNKQPRTNDNGWSSSLVVGRWAKTLHRKNKLVMEIIKVCITITIMDNIRRPGFSAF
jgi:hypothetical protein